MKKQIFNGSGVALVTPFDSKGNIDYKVFAKQIDYQINNGTNALVVCGTTGESATMSIAEREQAISFVAKTARGRITVIAGTGCNCTADTIAMSKFASSCGVDALLVVTPYYNKCSVVGLEAHYTAIAKSVDLPIILYNVPSRTNVNISTESCVRLAELANIVAIKEASGNINQIIDTAFSTSGKLDLYSGDDNIVVPVYSIGGIGVISVIANLVPSLMAKLCKLASSDIVQARKMQFDLLPLTRAVFADVNPIGIKKAMQIMGTDSGVLRLPLTDMSSACSDKLSYEIKELSKKYKF